MTSAKQSEKMAIDHLSSDIQEITEGGSLRLALENSPTFFAVAVTFRDCWNDTICDACGGIIDDCSCEHIDD